MKRVGYNYIAVLSKSVVIYINYNNVNDLTRLIYCMVIHRHIDCSLERDIV